MTLPKPEEIEAVARAIYELDPYWESGESVDGFAVSPGGFLTWEQAGARDAEFGDDPVFLPITVPARIAAQSAITALAALGWTRGGEGMVVVDRSRAVDGVAAWYKIKNTGSIEPGQIGDDRHDIAAFEALVTAAAAKPPAVVAGMEVDE